MSTSKIPEKTKQVLFGLAAGRCQYRGCNQLLTKDHLTQRAGKFSVFAHIVADRPGGPRGDPKLSEQLAKDRSNIMLLCLRHHRLIDVDAVEQHPIELLRQYKNDHEARIEYLTASQGEHRTLIISMAANIGQRKAMVESDLLKTVWPLYPLPTDVEIELHRLHNNDTQSSYWQVGIEEVRDGVERVKKLLLRYRLNHVSVFALAPIPLLMYLGLALGDIQNANPFQRRRDPPTWSWESAPKTRQRFVLKTPTTNKESVSDVVLVLSVSDTVDIQSTLETAPKDSLVYELRIPEPMTDVISCPTQVVAFRKVVRTALTNLKSRYGQNTTIHVFPALPNSLAIAFGQALLPKSDLPMIIYDLNRVWRRAIDLLPPPTMT